MIYKRREGGIIRPGFNYSFGKRVIRFALITRIPLPIFVYRIYDDMMRDMVYKCWQYYTVFIQFRILNRKYGRNRFVTEFRIGKFVFIIKVIRLPVRQPEVVNMRTP